MRGQSMLRCVLHPPPRSQPSTSSRKARRFTKQSIYTCSSATAAWNFHRLCTDYSLSQQFTLTVWGHQFAWVGGAVGLKALERRESCIGRACGFGDLPRRELEIFCGILLLFSCRVARPVLLHGERQLRECGRLGFSSLRLGTATRCVKRVACGRKPTFGMSTRCQHSLTEARLQKTRIRSRTSMWYGCNTP